MHGHDSIAILGYGCRLPGGVIDGESFWKLLEEKRDAITEVPRDRWNVDAFHCPLPGVTGRTISRWGGFLNSLDQFEPECFGISPREAIYVDPQQRLLLEAAYEACEMAGLPLENLCGSRTGVFVGVSTSDYGQVQRSTRGLPSVSQFSAHGGASSIAANRISYCFDLRGPSLVVDTACSSSLVALDRAVKSLRDAESDLALVGGVNAIIVPEAFISFSAASMLSPQGRCKAFDASGDGFVRSEGVGVVVLKRLDRAIRDRDRVLAVVLGSGVNQDGRTGGLSMPNAEAQETLLREVYRDAGVDPQDVAYVEAHGTGTAVGDPLEALAIGRVFGERRSADQALAMGSVKSNIGHLEAGSGIASLVKTLLMLEKRQIPPNLHFKNPNPKIDFHGLRLTVPTEMRPWPDAKRAVVGINSFGFGGTNAHVVLAEPLVDERETSEVLATSAAACGTNGQAPPRPNSVVPIVLSARSESALAELAGSWIQSLEKDANDDSFTDVAYTAAVRRSHHQHRLGFAARSRDDARERLRSFVTGASPPGVYRGVRPHDPPQVAFAFCGQGPQWRAMGMELLGNESVFRAAMFECDALLHSHTGWSLIDELTRSAEQTRISETSIAQCALFAIQVALTRQWTAWGVRADLVLGHSVGEVAAAHAAGYLTLEDAVRIVAHRGRCLQQHALPGRMIAVELTESAARELLGGDDSICIAAINAPAMVTLAGNALAIERCGEELTRRNVWWKALHVSHAFHSPLVEPARESFLAGIGRVDCRQPTCEMISTVRGLAVGADALPADYWWQNIRRTVRFQDAAKAIYERGVSTIIEIGPHPVLAASLHQCRDRNAPRAFIAPSLARGEDEPRTMLASLAGLFTQGAIVDWGQVWPQGGRHVTLPRHPWQRQRYWHESSESKQFRLAETFHPLLGQKSASAHCVWQTTFNKQELTWVRDHRAGGQMIFPAAGYIEMMLAAAQQELGFTAWALDNMNIRQALFLSTEKAPDIQTTLDPVVRRITISSRTGGENSPWMEHCHASVRPFKNNGPAERLDLTPWNSSGDVAVLEHGEFYELFRKTGIDYGPQFSGVRWARRRPGEALGWIEAPPEVAPQEVYRLHPALHDACIQVLSAVFPRDALSGERLYLPAHIRCVRIHRRLEVPCWSHVKLASYSPLQATVDIRVYDESLEPVVELLGLRLQVVPFKQARPAIETAFHEVQFHYRPLPDAASVVSPLELPAALPSIVAKVNARSEQLWTKEALQRMDASSRASDRLAGLYVASALESIDRARREAEILERYRAHYERCRSATASLDLNGATTASLWRELLEAYPQNYASLRLIELCGRRLVDIWLGRVDPLEVLFSDEASQALGESCRLEWSQYSNGFLAQLVEEVVRLLPEHRPLRVLEIGAGTGATTSSMLEVLPPRRTEYWVTDVSPYFVSQAEERFRSFEFARFALLDIERDPAEQNLPSGFDIVIASDVLHATSDILRALRRCIQLMVPGGLLLLRELCHQYLCLDMVFGLMEQWWNFRRDPARPQGLLLQSPQWKELLSQEGLESPTTPEQCDEVECGAVIVARKPLSSPSHDEKAAPHTSAGLDSVSLDAAVASDWLIFGDDSPLSPGLVRRWRQAGRRCIMVFPGDEFSQLDDHTFRIDPSSRADMGALRTAYEAIRQGVERELHVVHLWSAGVEATDADASAQHAESRICHCALHLLQEFADTPCLLTSLVFITRGAHSLGDHADPGRFFQGEAIGLRRVAASEFPAVHCRHIDLDARENAPGGLVDDELLWRELETSDRQDEVVWRAGRRFVPRLEQIDADLAPASPASTNGEVAPYEVSVRRPGELSSLELRQSLLPELGPDDVEIEIQFAAFNFRDVLKVLGAFPADEPRQLALGDECAGVVTAVGANISHLRPGDPVVALLYGCFRSRVRMPAAYVMRVPDDLPLVKAVTMPVAYLTADYALRQIGQLKPNETVLIHSAAGGVGLAAMAVARNIGARVFATAGSSAKRELLATLGADVVMDSHAQDFIDSVMEVTEGRGVDVVLNSLAGRAMLGSICCLAPFGRFLELGKRDFWEDTQVGLWPFRKNISYHAIDILFILIEHVELAQRRLATLLNDEALRSLPALPTKIYPAHQVVEAVRKMAQGAHIGKIVLDMRRPKGLIRSQPKRAAIRSDAAYLIAGAFGGVGMALARWLVKRGARSLILAGRRGSCTQHAQQLVDELRATGVHVHVAACDIGDKRQVENLLLRTRKELPPLAGVFHLAMVIDDGVLLNQTAARFHAALRPKVSGAWNLHRATLADPLDLFVMFGSAAATLGNFGSSNYAAANAALELLAAHRSGVGMPATLIAWGPLGEIGYVAERSDLSDALTRMGLTLLSPDEIFAALETAIVSNKSASAVFRADWKRLSQRVGGADFLSRLTSSQEDESFDGPLHGFRETFAATNAADQPKLAREFARSRVARVLGANVGAIATDRPLSEIGLDSLMGVELANLIESDLGVSISLSTISRTVTVDGLATALVKALAGGIVDAAAAPDAAASILKAPLKTETISPRLVTLTGAAAPSTLYCFHPAGGTTEIYGPLAAELASCCSVIGIESRLVAGAKTEFENVGAMSSAYADLLVADRVDAQQPFCLFSFSMGGLIALETARALVARGRHVAFVGLAECDPTWGHARENHLPNIARLIAVLVEHLNGVFGVFSTELLDKLPAKAARFAALLVEGEGGVEALLQWITRDGHLKKGVTDSVLQAYVHRVATHISLLAQMHEAQAPCVRVRRWVAERGLVWRRETSFNQPATADVQVLPGGHFDVMTGPQVRIIAGGIREELADITSVKHRDGRETVTATA